MKIKRFTAPSISEAMRNVKRELGGDAVILSNEAIDDGVEVVCAIDYDELLIGKINESDDWQPSSESPYSVENLEQLPELPLASLQGLGQGISPGAREFNRPQPDTAIGALREQTTRPTVPQNRPVPSPDMDLKGHTETNRNHKPKRIQWSQDPTLTEVKNSLGELQTLVEERLMGLVWKEASGMSPKKTGLMSRMTGVGFSETLARKTVEQIPADKEADRGIGFALALLSRQLRTGHPPLLNQGGIWAMVGPSGSGKTSTLIKLAARYLDQHGPQSVALVGFDLERIGAHQQLKVYGQLLDVPMRSVKKPEDIAPTLDSLSNQSLVLIDTSGFSPRDKHLENQLEVFQSYRSAEIKSLLMVPAVMEPNYLNRTLQMALSQGVKEAVLTRFDETTRPGIGLSCLIENTMELSFVGTGRNLIKDLIPAQAPELFSRVAELMQSPEQIWNQSHDQDQAQIPIRQQKSASQTTIARGISAHGN